MPQATIIEIDAYKPQIPGYTPEKAEQFHSQSAKLANREFDRVIKNTSHKKVILLSGGSASGKSEFVDSKLSDQDALIFDSTLSGDEGAKIKIKKARKYNLSVEVIGIVPRDLSIAFTAFLNRKRKLNEEHFYRTHCEFRRVLLNLAVSTGITISIYESESLERKLSYLKRGFNDRLDMIKFLEEIQITQEQIKLEIIKGYGKAN